MALGKSDCTDELWIKNCERYRELAADWLSWNGTDQKSVGPTLEELECFDTSEEFFAPVANRSVRRISGMKKLDQCKVPDDYCHSLSKFLKFEQIYQTIEMRQYDHYNHRLACIFDDFGKLVSYNFQTRVPEDRYSFEFAILQDCPKTWHEVVPTRVSDGILTLEVTELEGEFDESHSRVRWQRYQEPVNIAFLSNVTKFRACQVAIDAILNNTEMFNITFENMKESQRADYIDQEESDTHELLDRLKEFDNRQRQAIIRILRARCRPQAYIVIGPPGSGKSHVIVEAIFQIFSRSEDLKVLVCAATRQSVDRLYVNLLERLPEEDIFLITDRNQTNQDHKNKSIFLATNIDSNKLVDNWFEYNYVFVDDANHANVPEILVPMRLVKTDGCFVICGDPKQLSPRSHWEELDYFGLNSSLLDRLLKFHYYQVDGEERRLGNCTQKVQSKDHIARLTQSYRCDPRILAISNQLMYENQVKCLNKTPGSILNRMQLTCPVQIVLWGSVETVSDTSIPEAKFCANLITMLYKIGLEPRQIGVITSGRQQTKLISMELKSFNKVNEPWFDRLHPPREDRRNLHPATQTEASPALVNGKVHEKEARKRDWSCKIGSVTDFEGDERDIIIISPVYSRTVLRELGQPKILNVAMSRARWMVFILGNPEPSISGRLSSSNDIYWPVLLDNSRDEI